MKVIFQTALIYELVLQNYESTAESEIYIAALMDRKLSLQVSPVPCSSPCHENLQGVEV